MNSINSGLVGPSVVYVAPYFASALRGPPALARSRASGDDVWFAHRSDGGDCRRQREVREQRAASVLAAAGGSDTAVNRHAGAAASAGPIRQTSAPLPKRRSLKCHCAGCSVLRLASPDSSADVHRHRKRHRAPASSGSRSLNRPTFGLSFGVPSRPSDIIVIGAGIVGCAVALRARGARRVGRGRRRAHGRHAARTCIGRDSRAYIGRMKRARCSISPSAA